MHPTQTVIRRAAADDVTALVALARRSFFDAYCETDDHDVIRDYTSRHFTGERLAALVADPRSTVFLALDAATGELAGYAVVTESRPPGCVDGPAPIELSRLYLAKDRIGRGMGARLMREALDEARRRGGRTLWLGVYERNLRAIAFYRRFGLEFVGTTPFEWAGTIFQDPVMSMSIAP